MNPWIGVVGAIMGAIIGSGLALISVRFQLRHQTTRERHKLLLSKLEELYEVIANFRNAYHAKTLSIFESFGRALEIPFQHDYPALEISQVPVERIQMLAGFYAPQLLDDLETVGDSQRNMLPAFARCNKLIGSSDEAEIVVSLMMLANGLRQLENACSVMQGHLMAEAHARYL